jgi:hypothetical protein
VSADAAVEEVPQVFGESGEEGLQAERMATRKLDEAKDRAAALQYKLDAAIAGLNQKLDTQERVDAFKNRVIPPMTDIAARIHQELTEGAPHSGMLALLAHNDNA